MRINFAIEINDDFATIESVIDTFHNVLIGNVDYADNNIVLCDGHGNVNIAARLAYCDNPREAAAKMLACMNITRDIVCSYVTYEEHRRAQNALAVMNQLKELRKAIKTVMFYIDENTSDDAKQLKDLLLAADKDAKQHIEDVIRVAQTGNNKSEFKAATSSSNISNNLANVTEEDIAYLNNIMNRIKKRNNKKEGTDNE